MEWGEREPMKILFVSEHLEELQIINKVKLQCLKAFAQQKRYFDDLSTSTSITIKKALKYRSGCVVYCGIFIAAFVMETWRALPGG